MAIGMMQPKFQALIDDIRSRIESGELAPGDKLPSLTELVETTGCSTNTIRSTILVLKAQGLLVGRNGIGVFVAGDDQ